MDTLQFFTTLRIGWFNAWIPVFAMLFIQYLYMLIYKEGGKRAVDTSWYTAKDKCNFRWNSFFHFVLLVLSLFLPLKTGTLWFAVGLVLYTLAMIAFLSAFRAYAMAPLNATIEGGIYRYSRNPMYFAFTLGVAAAGIASASLWMLLAIIPFAVSTHAVILGEERYCEQTYGKEYLDYKAKTPRYFLFF